MFAGLVTTVEECLEPVLRPEKAKVKHYIILVGHIKKRNGRKFCAIEYIQADVLEQIVLSDINAMIGSVHNLETLLLDNIKRMVTRNKITRKLKEQEKQALNAQLYVSKTF